MLSKKLIVLLCLSLTILVCCKKSDNRQLSYWYVNADSFMTSDVRTDIGKAATHLVANSFENAFFLEFHLKDFPVNGSFLINCSLQNPAWVCFAITYHSKGYIASSNAYINAVAINGSYSYQLEPTWFYNETDHKDSVRVHGTFTQP